MKILGYILTIPVRIYITIILLAISPIVAGYIILSSHNKIAVDLKNYSKDFSETWRNKWYNLF